MHLKSPDNFQGTTGRCPNNQFCFPCEIISENRKLGVRMDSSEVPGTGTRTDAQGLEREGTFPLCRVVLRSHQPVTSGLGCLLEAAIMEIHKVNVVLPRAAREPRAAKQRDATVPWGCISSCMTRVPRCQITQSRRSYQGLQCQVADRTAECWRRTRKEQLWQMRFLFEVFIIVWG